MSWSHRLDAAATVLQPILYPQCLLAYNAQVQRTPGFNVQKIPAGHSHHQSENSSGLGKVKTPKTQIKK
jgi:hypothetical protein